MIAPPRYVIQDELKMEQKLRLDTAAAQVLPPITLNSQIPLLRAFLQRDMGSIYRLISFWFPTSTCV